MAARRMLCRILSAALALTLVLGVAPALAGSEPVVGFHVTVSGTDLYHMNAADAHAAIAAACTTPTLAPLPVTAAGTQFELEVATAVACDVDGMVTDALAATADGAMAPRWSAGATGVASFVVHVAGTIYRAPVNAGRVIVKKRLRLTPSVDGLALDSAAARTAITAAVTAELAADGAAQPRVMLASGPVAPAVTIANIGKTIVVVLHERRVYLYNGAALEKKYRCAIGMRAHPTPRGIFKVVRKSPHPTWTNPGSAWAKSMPSFIRPGYFNPLGLRALYLSASGIRIHGTSKTSSMGQAASHGCIRLTNVNIKKLYPRVAVGTPVYIVK